MPLAPPKPFQFPALSYNLAVADLNGDGLPDTVASTPSAKTVTLLLSSSTPTAPTVALAASGSNLLVGSDLTLTAKIRGGSGVPTGTVTLLDGSNPLGRQALDANGAAQFTLSTLGVGSHALTVSYSGDARYGAGTSPALNQQVTDVIPSLANGTQTVAAGSSAAYSLDLASQAGFTGSVTLTSSGLPSYATCSAAPVTVTSNSAVATVTVATTQSALAWAGPANGSFYACALGGVFLLSVRRLGGRRIALPAFCTFGFLLLVTAALSGCGGPAKTTPAPPQPASQTSAFTIKAVATQNGVSVMHSVTATLIVHS